MNITKLKKYINLALNNSSIGEASTAARMFFSKLTQMGGSFNPAVFGITRGEAAKLATLAGKTFKGLNDGAEAEVKPAPTKSKARKNPETNTMADLYKRDGYQTKREACYAHFANINMNNGAARRNLIEMLCARYGFSKASVQSYASNFRKEV